MRRCRDYEGNDKGDRKREERRLEWCGWGRTNHASKVAAPLCFSCAEVHSCNTAHTPQVQAVAIRKPPMTSPEPGRGAANISLRRPPAPRRRRPGATWGRELEGGRASRDRSGRGQAGPATVLLGRAEPPLSARRRAGKDVGEVEPGLVAEQEVPLGRPVTGRTAGAEEALFAALVGVPA